MINLIFDRPSNSGFYDAVIKLLGEITGVKWGFYKPKRRVQYVSSAEIPLKVGALWGKNYEKTCKPLDIEICNKYPKIYGAGEWADAAGYELKTKLLAAAPTQYIAKLLSWRPSANYLAARAHADEQKKKWAGIAPIPYDKYHDEIVHLM